MQDRSLQSLYRCTCEQIRRVDSRSYAQLGPTWSKLNPIKLRRSHLLPPSLFAPSPHLHRLCSTKPLAPHPRSGHQQLLRRQHSPSLNAAEARCTLHPLARAGLLPLALPPSPSHWTDTPPLPSPFVLTPTRRLTRARRPRRPLSHGPRMSCPATTRRADSCG